MLFPDLHVGDRRSRLLHSFRFPQLHGIESSSSFSPLIGFVQRLVRRYAACHARIHLTFPAGGFFDPHAFDLLISHCFKAEQEFSGQKCTVLQGKLEGFFFKRLNTHLYTPPSRFYHGNIHSVLLSRFLRHSPCYERNVIVTHLLHISVTVVTLASYTVRVGRGWSPTHTKIKIQGGFSV